MIDTGTPDSSATRLPIAVDAMGGDRAPENVVEAAVQAVRDRGIPVLLVGHEARLTDLVAGLGGPYANLSLIDAPEVVTMEEHAVAAVRRKARASITVAVGEVATGRASAVVSAGHSGAVVASALFGLGRLPNIERPGIAIPFPTRTGALTYVIDAGAVSDPRPAHLLGFARLITIYVRQMTGIAAPRIGLLSNGEEQTKGNNLTRESHDLLANSADLNFVGNVEANALPDGVVDALVCDGFSGNVLLKAAEGTAMLMQSKLRHEMTARWYLKPLALGLRPAFRRAARSLDYREYGGAPLLGVNGMVIMAHGRSDARAIRNAIIAAWNAAQENVIGALRSEHGTVHPPTTPDS